MSQQGKKNIYLCTQCGRGHVTVDLDKGTTPFMMACLHCGGDAMSMFYAAPQEALARVPAAVEWYKPGAEETVGLSPGLKQHVQMGGLLHRLSEAGSAPAKVSS